MDFWDAETYSQFIDLRTRPARDLLWAFPETFLPKTVYDLGCGPGNSTMLLKQRWPHAQIIGLDSSIDMLKKANKDYPSIKFIKADIAQFSPLEKIDCIFANASLQWLEPHEAVFPRLLQFIRPGGMFGIQMPNNFHSPTHQITIKLLQNNKTWQPFLKQLRYGTMTAPFYKATWYYDLLTQSKFSCIQLWETEYFQEMSNHQDIFDWVKGTGLRPILTAMDSKNQHQFANAYVAALVKEYPVQMNNKILLPYRRIFMVGAKT